METDESWDDVGFSDMDEELNPIESNAAAVGDDSTAAHQPEPATKFETFKTAEKNNISKSNAPPAVLVPATSILETPSEVVKNSFDDFDDGVVEYNDEVEDRQAPQEELQLQDQDKREPVEDILAVLSVPSVHISLNKQPVHHVSKSLSTQSLASFSTIAIHDQRPVRRHYQRPVVPRAKKTSRKLKQRPHSARTSRNQQTLSSETNRAKAVPSSPHLMSRPFATLSHSTNPTPQRPSSQLNPKKPRSPRPRSAICSFRPVIPSHSVYPSRPKSSRPLRNRANGAPASRRPKSAVGREAAQTTQPWKKQVGVAEYVRMSKTDRALHGKPHWAYDIFYLEADRVRAQREKIDAIAAENFRIESAREREKQKKREDEAKRREEVARKVVRIQQRKRAQHLAQTQKEKDQKKREKEEKVQLKKERRKLVAESRRKCLAERLREKETIAALMEKMEFEQKQVAQRKIALATKILDISAAVTTKAFRPMRPWAPTFATSRDSPYPGLHLSAFNELQAKSSNFTLEVSRDAATRNFEHNCELEAVPPQHLQQQQALEVLPPEKICSPKLDEVGEMFQLTATGLEN